jgi:hypothetical protein
MRTGGSSVGVVDFPLTAAADDGVSDTPHSPQNLNSWGFSNPHDAHLFLSGVAQLPQNFIPAGFSVPQLAHRMMKLYPGKLNRPSGLFRSPLEAERLGQELHER